MMMFPPLPVLFGNSRGWDKKLIVISYSLLGIGYLLNDMLQVTGCAVRYSDAQTRNAKSALRNSEYLHKLDIISKNKLYGKREIETMEFETAFSMDTSSIKYGPGVTREVGWDMEEQGARRVMVVTDQNMTASESGIRGP